MSNSNPLLPPIIESFKIKRAIGTGLVSRNWLLIMLRLLDLLHDSEKPLVEDEVYTYDYTLKNSRAAAIPALLSKHGFPTKLGLSREGVTVRGAPGLRVFRAWKGGRVIMDFPVNARRAMVLEAIELVRAEVLRVVEQKPVMLGSSCFDQTGTFITELLDAVVNRSQGRVEQALVGAKLQLRFPKNKIPDQPAFAPDKQTGRESDYDIDNMRVIVSVAPKDVHYLTAAKLASENREVTLVVTEKTFAAAKNRIKRDKESGRVLVIAVEDYVTSNMKEIAHDRNVNARQMCLLLVAEYNRRIAYDNDTSLQIVIPSE